MNYLKTILFGLIATAVMTGFMLLAPLIGLPNMNVGIILGSMVNSQAWGWVIHFIIGIALALPYALVFNRWIPVENKILRGIIYGLLVFVVSEIIVTSINMAGFLYPHEKEMMSLMIFGSSIAHMIYGGVLGSFFERTGPDAMEENKREG